MSWNGQITGPERQNPGWAVQTPWYVLLAHPETDPVRLKSDLAHPETDPVHAEYRGQ